MHEVFSRIMTAMESGIEIGDRHFEFLAFGNSQVREHGAYFFASTDHISAADIRAWMGDFRDIRVVAKHAARLGQCYCEFLIFPSKMNYPNHHCYSNHSCYPRCPS